MTATSHTRGHPIYYDGFYWRYRDTDELVAFTWRDRSCGHCGLYNTPEGHDPCIGTLPSVRNACCGHGHLREAYIQYEDGTELRGQDALDAMAQHVEFDWWCDSCQDYLSPSRVTSEELCDTCGNAVELRP